MPDWLAYVNERLDRLSLPEMESLQVREELAAHLEDTFLSLRAQGAPESEAFRLACDQVSSWQELQTRPADSMSIRESRDLAHRPAA